MLAKKIVCLLLLIFSPLCFGKSADTLVVAQKIDELITLDPAVLYEVISLEYTNNTYQRLVKYNPDAPGNPLPDIAASWKVTNDGKTYTFYLKPDLKFASGNPITAHDVEYSFKRVLELKKSPSFYFSQFGLTTDGIVVQDDLTISFYLTETQPANLFLNTLTSPAGAIVDSIIVKENTKNNDWGNEWLSRNSAGSGPFLLSKWQPNEVLLLKRNENYPRPVAMKSVVVRHVAEPSTQRLLVIKGDVDIARDLSDFTNMPSNVYLISESKSWIQYIALNQNNQYLQKPEVSRAIKYLIDYDKIQNSIMQYKAMTHQSFIPRGFMAANTENPFTYNVPKAKELLKSVGLEQGFKVRLDAKDVELAQALKSQLAAANIELEIVPADSKQVISKFRSRDFDMIVATWAPDYVDPHAIAVSFLINQDNSDSADNKSVAWRSNWFIPRLSELAIQASKMQDGATREKMYQDLQQKFFAEAPIVVMFQRMETAAVNKNVTGFTLGPNADTTSYCDVKKSL